VGVGAADEFDMGHDAGAGRAGGFQQKPGDRCGLRGWALLEDVAFDCAAIVGFPDGTGAVGAYGFAGCVDEFGFGGLKDPLRSCGGLLAAIDLEAFAGGGEDGALRGWRFCGVLRGCSGCEECCTESQEDAGSLHDRAVYAKDVSPVWRNETECGRCGWRGRILE
jgi:hypothetical protein